MLSKIFSKSPVLYRNVVQRQILYSKCKLSGLYYTTPARNFMLIAKTSNSYFSKQQNYELTNTSKKGFFEFNTNKSDSLSRHKKTMSMLEGFIPRGKNQQLLQIISPEDDVILVKHYSDLSTDIDFQKRTTALYNLHQYNHLNLKFKKSIDQKVRESHYYIIDYFWSEEVRKTILKTFDDNQYNDLLLNLNYLLINEYYLYRKQQSILTEESIDFLDTYVTHAVEKDLKVRNVNILHWIIKSLQLRSRKFRQSEYNEKSITQFFESKLTLEDWKALSEYDMAQICLNLSFVDQKYYKFLFKLKNAIIEKIKENYDKMVTKNIVQIVSCIYRLELVLKSNEEDVDILNKAVFDHLKNMNIIDIQSVLSGMSFLYEDKLYNPNLVNPMIDKIINGKEPINSLILTNLMKSMVALRVDHKEFYRYIVHVIQENYHKFDNVALSYTLARLIRLNQMDCAKELLEFYINEIDFLNKICNAHNKCQIMLGLATLKNYDEEIWASLLNSFEGHNFYADKHSNSEFFVESAILFRNLAKKEAPKMYKKLLKDTDLEKFIENYDLKKAKHTKEISISNTQTEMVRAVEKLGYTVKNEYEIEGRTVDLFVEDHNLIIDFHGPAHYLNASDTKIGNGLYSTRLLPSTYKYLEIPYYEVSCIGNNKLQSYFKLSAPLKNKFDNLEDYLKAKIKETIGAKK
jgi:hypothetical protein